MDITCLKQLERITDSKIVNLIQSPLGINSSSLTWISNGVGFFSRGCVKFNRSALPCASDMLRNRIGTSLK